MTSQRTFWFSESMDATGGDSEREFPSDVTESDKEHANLVASLCENGKHMPVIDFDFPARLVPSSTQGNHHLYIDVEMEWDKYAALLVALRDSGLVQKGFVNSSIERKMSMCRPEWVKKAGDEQP